MDRSPDSSACVFCRIVSGEAPAHVVYRDDLLTAFRDSHPFASTHILIVPNRHIASVNDLEEGEQVLVGHMVWVAKKLAASEGLTTRGFRLLINTGEHGGQTVLHLHLHLLGGPLARLALK